MLTILDGPNGADLVAIDRGLTALRTLDGKGTIHRTTPACLDSRETMLNLLACSFELPSFRALHLSRWWIHFALRDIALGNGNTFERSWTRVLDRLALSQQAVIVLCMPPVEVCRHRWLLTKALRRETATPNDMVSFDLIHLQYQELERMARDGKTTIPTVVYDETQHTDDELSRLVEAFRPAKNQGPGVGMWHAGVTLMVGERPNIGQQERYLGPFCSTKSTGCSEWLNDQLNEAGVSESSLYWINAVGRDGQETDPSFVSRLKPGRIVALGEVAHKWCGQHGLEHAHVPHPQHWKRFHAAERYPLLDLL